MPLVDPVAALLARQSRASLITMEAELRKEIDYLVAQLAIVQRALMEKGVAQAPREAREAPTRPRRRDGNRREAFREVLAAGGDMAVAEIWHALYERGVDSNTAAVRVMLRRMRDAGEVERTDRGWKLVSAAHPAQNGAGGGLSGTGEEPLLFAAPRQEAN